MNSDTNQLKEELEKKKKIILELNQAIEFHKQLKELHDKNQLKDSFVDSISKETFEKQISELNALIEELHAKLGSKESQIKITQQRFKLKESEYKESQHSKKKYVQFYQNHRTEIVKLKEYIEKIKEKNKSLKKVNFEIEEKLKESEKTIRELRLKIEDTRMLTPRPDFIKVNFLFNENFIENSTRAKVEFLEKLIIKFQSKKKNKVVSPPSAKKFSNDTTLSSKI